VCTVEGVTEKSGKPVRARFGPWEKVFAGLVLFLLTGAIGSGLMSWRQVSINQNQTANTREWAGENFEALHTRVDKAVQGTEAVEEKVDRVIVAIQERIDRISETHKTLLSELRKSMNDQLVMVAEVRAEVRAVRHEQARSREDQRRMQDRLDALSAPRSD